MSEIDGNDPDLQLRGRARAARFQISENTLFNAGLDRPTVEALRHLLNKVGNQADTPSLPDAVIGIESLEVGPVFLEPLQLPDDLTPAMQPLEPVEFLQAEVRQLAELVAELTNRIHDIEQGLTP